MFATLMKILPVLWPFFKEMVLGGKKDIEAVEKPSRLKALFYIIMFLLVSLGFGGHEAFKLLQQLHTTELKNASLIEKARSDSDALLAMKMDRDYYRTLSDDRFERIKTLRDQQDQLIRQQAKSEADLQNAQAEIKRLTDQNTELENKVALAEKAAKNLDTFRTTRTTPKRLIRHNEAVDVLKQLREDSTNETAR